MEIHFSHEGLNFTVGSVEDSELKQPSAVVAKCQAQQNVTFGGLTYARSWRLVGEA